MQLKAEFRYQVFTDGTVQSYWLFGPSNVVADIDPSALENLTGKAVHLLTYGDDYTTGFKNNKPEDAHGYSQKDLLLKPPEELLKNDRN